MKPLKYVFLLSVGGLSYCLIEYIFRGKSHWSMFFVGGAAFVICGLLNEVFPWEFPLIYQMIICSIIITVMELSSGIVLNICLGLNVWDYSDMPGNYLGQICPALSVLWFFLGGVAVVLDDYIRYWFLGEERPRYKIV